MPAAVGIEPRPRHAAGADPPHRPPLHHHPVVALSAMATTACVAQLVIWLMQGDAPAPPPVPCSSLVAHDLVYRPAMHWIESRAGEASQAARAAFVAHLALCLLSAAAWYAAIHLAFGPGWAFWTALLWAAHPLFALTARQPGAAGPMIFGVAAAWMMLMWWGRSASLRAAFIAGLSWGLTLFTSLLPLLLAPVILMGLLFSPPALVRRLAGAMLFAAAFLLPAAAAWGLLRTSGQAASFRERLEIDLWNRIDVADGTPISRAAREVRAARPVDSPRPGPAAFLAGQALHAPTEAAGWLVRRFLFAPVSDSGSPPRGEVAALQWTALLPAGWGLLTALRLRPWRWAAAVSAALGLLIWVAVAVVDPRVRSLAPVGALAVALAVIGLADIYERLFGRRLIATR